MPVKPPAPKHKTEDLGNKLIISIPNMKLWFLIIYFGFCLIFLAFGDFVVLGILIFNRNGWDKTTIPFLVLVAVFLTIAGGFMIYSLAWQISGKEVIEITTQSITIRKVSLGPSFPKEYSANYIKELRVSSSNMNTNHLMLIWAYGYTPPWQNYNIGSLAFDYGARTFRFGSSVDEAEAKQIVAEIEQKYPQYRN
jgi:phage shock protein PspC (stress-responsive transcriptional regulator)